MRKCCIPYIPCRPLLLSTIVLNDNDPWYKLFFHCLLIIKLEKKIVLFVCGLFLEVTTDSYVMEGFLYSMHKEINKFARFCHSELQHI